MSEPAELKPSAWKPTSKQRLPTRRNGEILPPGASRRNSLCIAATGIPAWVILGLIWWRAIVEEPDQLLFGVLIWAGCAVFTFVTVFSWVFWNRSLAHRREKRYGGRSGAPEGTFDYAKDALGRRVSIVDGATVARHLQVRTTKKTKFIEGVD